MSNVAIVSTGRYVPETYVYSKDVYKDVGLNYVAMKGMKIEKVHLAKNETAISMGVKSAKIALERAEIKPEDVDAIYYTGVMSDYILCQAAAEIQHQLGAINAYVTSFEQFCCSSLAAIECAYYKLKGDKNIKNILIVSSDIFESPGVNRWTAASSNFYGDGSSAAVLKRSDKGFIIKDTNCRADGSFNKLWRVPVGGLKEPITDLDILKNEFRFDCKKTAAEYLQDTKGTKYLYNVMIENNKKVFIELLDRNNLSIEDIDKLIVYNVGNKMLRLVLKSLKYSKSKTSCYLAMEYGHMGSTDLIFNLDHMLDDKKFSNGNIVAFFGAAGGLSWRSMLTQYIM